MISSPYLHFLHSVSKKKDVGPTQVIIYSPFNCGSNLLEKLLSSLFSISFHQDLVWKHTLQPSYHPNHLHILILKNPYVWFQSIIKSPYHIEWDGTYHLFDQTKITFHNPHLNKTNTYSNIYEIWIEYYQIYQSFLNKTGNSYVIQITYEELLYHPEKILSFFSTLWNQPLPHNYQHISKNIFEKPAKDHGYCHNYTEALEANDMNKIKDMYQKEFPHAIFEFKDTLQKSKLTIHPSHSSIWNLSSF